MKIKFAIAATVFCALGAMVAAPARAAFTFDIQPSYGDELTIHMRNYEPLISGVPGTNLYGVLIIDQIINATTSQTAWAASDHTTASSNPGELTGVFNNYTLISSGTTGDIYFTGGNVNIFYDSTPDAVTTGNLVAAGTNLNPDPTGKFGNGTSFLTTVGQVGGFVDNPLTLLVNESLATLFTHVNSGTTASFGFRGTGTGLLSVTGGSNASTFNGNSQTAGADLEINTTLRGAGSGLNPAFYPVLSSDPIATLFTAPEATSIAAWSFLSLAGALVMRARNKRVQS